MILRFGMALTALIALAVPVSGAMSEGERCADRPRLCETIRRKLGADALVARKPNPPATATLRYGADPRQALDFWRSDAALRKGPLLVFVHGGGWTRGDKATATGPDKIAAFRARGYGVASINYRMPPTVGVEQEPKDVAAAILFLRSRASELGFDPDRIVLMGHSAGAHLAALVATDATYLGKALPAIRAVVLLDGAGYDLTRERDDDTPLVARIYERAFGKLSETELARLSPVRHAAQPNAGAFLIVYDADRADAVQQSVALEQALRDGGTTVQRAPIGNTSHMQLNWNVGLPGDGETAEIMAFLEREGL